MNRRQFLTLSMGASIALSRTAGVAATPARHARSGVLIHALMVGPGGPAPHPGTGLTLRHLQNDMGHHHTALLADGAVLHVTESSVVGTLLVSGEPLTAHLCATLPGGLCRIELRLDRPLAAGERLPLCTAHNGGIDAQLLDRVTGHRRLSLTALPGYSYLPMRTGPAVTTAPAYVRPAIGGYRLRQGLLREPERLLAQFGNRAWRDQAPAAIAIRDGARTVGFLCPTWDRDTEQLLLRGERLEAHVIDRDARGHPGAARLEVALVG